MIGIGVFRLILALTVIITHTHSLWGFTLGNPVIAVRTFFIISGFYMSLVLNEKYSSHLLFWRNRFLKIYPVYWVTLILTVLSCLGAYWLRGNWGEMYYIVTGFAGLHLWDKFTLVFSHFLIFGRSLIMFGLLNGISGINYLLIPQAWTLVIELTFYLMAPFILRRNWSVIACLMFLSCGSKWYLHSHGFTGDLWDYRFFPNELVYFLMGWWSYRFYRYLLKTRPPINNYFRSLFLTIAIVALSTFNYWPGNIYLWEWVFYMLMAFLISFIFYFSRSNRWDRQIGELSYPVYIVHILINNLINPLVIVPLTLNKNWQSLIVLLGSVVISWLMLEIIQKPIEKIRTIKANI